MGEQVIGAVSSARRLAEPRHACHCCRCLGRERIVHFRKRGKTGGGRDLPPRLVRYDESVLASTVLIFAVIKKPINDHRQPTAKCGIRNRSNYYARSL